ncbi:unnamed protein product [Adineta steineri]|uniref:Uncharacterized protein n=1 Tax=Adineta steineri TaxID=433720 RepID=A0A814IIM2_9BILA|nr:unnamed protein product [Adineta steineri]CAF1045327.1 unnamed protein product [Adineta steineri]
MTLLFLKEICVQFQQKKLYYATQFIIIIILFIINVLLYQPVFYSLPTNTLHNITKYRIAHCMTGAPRTLYKEELYVAYRRQALDQLPGDLFVILQLMDKTENVHGASITNSGPKGYIAALKYLSPRKVEWIPINDRLRAADDHAGYAKWQRCLEHIEQAEKQDGIKYDFIVRTRPDLYFAKDLPTADLLPKNRILISPYYECLQDIPSGYNQTWPDLQAPCDKNNQGLSDLFAIMPRTLADPYMRVAYIQNLPKHVCGSQSHYAECRIRATLYKANMTYEIWPFIIKIMRPLQFCHARHWNRFNSWC